MLFSGIIKPWKCLALTCPATYLKAKKARYHLKHSQILLKCTPVILPTLISLWYSIAYLWLWLTDCFASTGSSHVPLNIIYCLCLLLEQVCSLPVRVLGQIAGASRSRADYIYRYGVAFPIDGLVWGGNPIFSKDIVVTPTWVNKGTSCGEQRYVDYSL